MGAFLSFILGFMGSTALLLRGGVLGKISYAQMGYAHTLSDFSDTPPPPLHSEAKGSQLYSAPSDGV